MAQHLGPAEQLAQYRHASFATPGLQQVKLSAHDRFSDRPIDLAGEVADRVGAADAVADVGCGTAPLARHLAASGHKGPVFALDISAGVFADARADAARRRLPIAFAAAAAEQLPFPDRAVDVVCFGHMLGFVDDMVAACREARRVLRPGGRLIATANSQYSYPHARYYRGRAAALFRWGKVRVNTERFCAENMADVLGHVFPAVEVTALEGHLRIPAPDYVGWFEQMIPNWNPLPSPAEQAVVLSRLTDEWLPRDLDDGGCIPEPKVVGIATCTDPEAAW